MPFDNLNNVHFLPTEKTAALDAITALETALAAKFRNLSAEERKRYGSINEQNKLIVNKVLDYRNNQPALSSADVDWAEFQNDFDSRTFIQATISRLQNIIDGLNNNKILHDYDNYQAALTIIATANTKPAQKRQVLKPKLPILHSFLIEQVLQIPHRQLIHHQQKNQHHNLTHSLLFQCKEVTSISKPTQSK